MFKVSNFNFSPFESYHVFPWNTNSRKVIITPVTSSWLKICSFHKFCRVSILYASVLGRYFLLVEGYDVLLNFSTRRVNYSEKSVRDFLIFFFCDYLTFLWLFCDVSDCLCDYLTFQSYTRFFWVIYSSFQQMSIKT